MLSASRLYHTLAPLLVCLCLAGTATATTIANRPGDGAGDPLAFDHTFHAVSWSSGSTFSNVVIDVYNILNPDDPDMSVFMSLRNLGPSGLLDPLNLAAAPEVLPDTEMPVLQSQSPAGLINLQWILPSSVRLLAGNQYLLIVGACSDASNPNFKACGAGYDPAGGAGGSWLRGGDLWGRGHSWAELFQRR